MSEWAGVAVIGIIAVYKLIERWIDSRQGNEPAERESDTYAATELAHRDPSQYDGGYHERPEIQLGFQRE